MMVSNGLPPAPGNVCVGIWKQVAPRTFKLKHMTWNWDANGGFAGTFLLDVTLRLDRRGNSYMGTWVADSYDPDGTIIPELHAEGIARGTRISLNWTRFLLVARQSSRCGAWRGPSRCRAIGV
jgi:hypothetical protein